METLKADALHVEFVDEVAGLYFRSALLPNAFTRIPQHAHDHDHATVVCSGKARLLVDGKWSGDFNAGQVVKIEAGRLHEFESLEANTRLMCVHDVASAESVKRQAL